MLNRVSDSTVDDAVPELATLVDRDDAVHVGGPVQPSAVVVLAEFAESEQAGTLVLGSVGFLPSEVDPLELGELRRARVFAGYAGWGPGQLDGELEEGSWIVEPAIPDDVFTLEPESLWSAVLRARAVRSASSRSCRPIPRSTERTSRVGSRGVAGVETALSALPRAAILRAASSRRLQGSRPAPRHAARSGALRRGRDARRVRRGAAAAERAGLHANTTLLGEAIPTPEGAAAVVAEYERILDRIASEQLRANVALKLTHLGLSFDEETAYENVERLVAHAAAVGDVRPHRHGAVGVHGRRRSDIYERLRAAGHENVGTVLQSYLYRSAGRPRATASARAEPPDRQGRVPRARLDRIPGEAGRRRSRT